jgi:hypothetical protein
MEIFTDGLSDQSRGKQAMNTSSDQSALRATNCLLLLNGCFKHSPGSAANFYHSLFFRAGRAIPLEAG